MMKLTANSYFVVSTVCMVAISLIFEKKLSHINSATIVFCYSLFMACSTLLLRQVIKTDDPSYDFPSGLLMVWFLALGILFVINDLSHAQGFVLKGTAEDALLINAAAPIVVILCKFILYRVVPTPVQIIGYILFFTGIALIFTNKIPNSK